MNEKLKPCPFCGGKAYVDDPNYNYVVRCYKCRVSTAWYADKNKALKAWNTRTGEEEKCI